MQLHRITTKLLLPLTITIYSQRHALKRWHINIFCHHMLNEDDGRIPCSQITLTLKKVDILYGYHLLYAGYND